MAGMGMGAFVPRRRQKWAWSERLIERERIKEYALMICGAASNDKVAHTVQILTAVCNAQHAKSVNDGRRRAEAKKAAPPVAPVDLGRRRRALAEFLEDA